MEKLEGQELRTWFDEKNLKHSISQDIIDGLNQSASVVVFLTERYIQRCENPNNNCTKELSVAVKKGVENMILIILDPSCSDQNTWSNSAVGFHFMDKLYIDLLSPSAQEKNFDSLCNRILEISGDKVQ